MLFKGKASLKSLEVDDSDEETAQVCTERSIEERQSKSGDTVDCKAAILDYTSAPVVGMR